MLGLLHQKGWVPSEMDEADVVIINTCGFIREAKEESIETILTAAADKEKGKYRHLVVAGCLPQRYGKDLSRNCRRSIFFWGRASSHKSPTCWKRRPAGNRSRKILSASPATFMTTKPPDSLPPPPGACTLRFPKVVRTVVPTA